MLLVGMALVLARIRGISALLRQVEDPAGADEVRIAQRPAVGELFSLVQPVDLAPPEPGAELPLRDTPERVARPHSIDLSRRFGQFRVVEHASRGTGWARFDRHRLPYGGEGRGGMYGQRRGHQGAPDCELDQASHDLRRKDGARCEQHALPPRTPGGGNGRSPVQQHGER
jgi:hypothetical protein